MKDIMPEELAKLRVLANKTLKVEGNGPIHCTITTAIADAILNQKPQDVKAVLLRMTPVTRTNFDKFLELDKTLKKKMLDVAQLPDFFKVIKPEDVIEELKILIDPIAVIIFTKQGERYVSRNARDYSDLLTFDEFQMKHQRSVGAYLHSLRDKLVDALDRAITLVDADPVEYTLNVMNKDMAMFDITLTVWSKDQLDLFAKNQGVEIMATSETKE